MTSLFDQSIYQSSRCFACGAIVYAVEKKLTTHHVYHNRCFRCRICKRNLTGFSLNEEGDDIYCANCYRKKQRGDCNSFEFIRAAAEKAQYVHNRHHPDQSESLNSPRISTGSREISAHPSSTLRQMERQYLSQKNISISSNPRRNSNISNEDSSSHSSPLFSPRSTKRSVAIITPAIDLINDDEPKSINLPTGSGQGAIEFRLNKSNIDLSEKNRHTTQIPDLNQPKDRFVRDIATNNLYFSDLNIQKFYRRSTSANRLGLFQSDAS